MANREKALIAERKYTATHREEINLRKREQIKQKRKANPELFRKKDKERYWKNPQKMRNEANERYKLNPEQRRKYLLKHTYGITIEEYNLLVEVQSGKCAICGSTESKTKQTKNLFVDHDHKTNKIRGLLCKRCNVALGEVEDSIETLEKAITYLKYHGQ